MKIQTCCFTGHRHLSNEEQAELVPTLDRYLQALCDLGCTEFRVGGALGFDTLAAQRVLLLREKHPACHLHMILPCKGQADRFAPADKLRYDALLAQADRVEWLSPKYYRGCMLARDRVMVDRADCCVCWLTKSEGGTAYTVRLAVNKGLPLYNMAEDPE